MNNMASALTGTRGERVALTDVSVSAVLQDLLAEVTVVQAYRNDEPLNIEAVYTFPLPLDAVLLELDVEIGGRKLKGVVVEKKVAEEKYEDAIVAGDTAVMLEVIEPGLYTMNVGNLLPNETARITFKYAMLYRWAGDRLRFFLPTTIAPKYGESPHLAHQAPESSIAVENDFSLRIEILGKLRDAQFVCPSHSIKCDVSDERVVISLQESKAVMDRDFILNVKAPQASRSFALCGKDPDGIAAIASFQPFFSGLQQPRPLNLAIVIDCSGSMQGDSIAQAKQALEGILDAMDSRDRVTLVAFGNATKVLSDKLLSCNKTNLAKAKRFAKQLDANMGGTNIGGALDAAFEAVSGQESADVFLLTDGEVSSWQTVVAKAQHAGHRIFTVGVGSAVSEAFVRGLAEATGGECELVSPREGMADRVIRHFERMRSPRAIRVSIHWPEGAHDDAPARIGAIFEGDTVVASARLDRTSPAGTVTLEVETDTGKVMRQELTLAMALLTDSVESCSTVARLAAAARIKAADEQTGLKTALAYRLVSKWTNWLVVAERPESERAMDLPELRKVPQTMAAGWGGTGSVRASISVDPVSSSRIMYSMSCADEAMECCSPDDDDRNRRALGPEYPEPYHRLVELIEEGAMSTGDDASLDLLKRSGLAKDFGDLLDHAQDLGIRVEAVADIILAWLIGGRLGEFISFRSQSFVEFIQERARRASELIKEMSRAGRALDKVIAGPTASDILRPSLRDDMRRMLDPIHRFHDLLRHIEDSQERAMDRMREYRIAQDRREAEATRKAGAVS